MRSKPGESLSTRLFRRGTLHPETGCLEWPVASGDLYGRITVAGKKEHVHRLTYALCAGIPMSDLDGVVIAHHCDNPRCYRPSHLFRTTDRGNAFDRQIKGRGARGAKTRRTKRTPEEILEIRRLRAEGMKLSELAERFNMSVSGIHHALARTWRWLDDDRPAGWHEAVPKNTELPTTPFCSSRGA